MPQKELPAVMALSYLGDAVYSLYVRRRLVRMGISHAGELNRMSLDFVTAPRQAALAKRLAPKMVIPMHYKTPRLTFEIAPLAPFLAAAKDLPVCALGMGESTTL